MNTVWKVCSGTDCAVIVPEFFLLCMCSKRVHVFSAAYYVRMQAVNKLLINPVLNTGISSDMLKIYQSNDT